MTRPWPISRVEMNYHAEMENGEISVYEEEKVHVDRHMGGLRESHTHDSLSHSHGTFLPGFLWPVISLCPVPSLI